MSDDQEVEDDGDKGLDQPAPVEIEITLGGKKHQLSYERAFALAYSLLRKGNAAEAAKVFERLEEFVDRGPRAFIMQAFCEAAAMHFDRCSQPLSAAFAGDQAAFASELHNAFVSYHVGIRNDGIKAMADLVNRHQELPTLSLLLGDMLEAAGDRGMAEKCWTLAAHRDRRGGAVGALAMHRLRRQKEGNPLEERRA